MGGTAGRASERDGERESVALDQSPCPVAPSSMRRSTRDVTSVAYVETRLPGDASKSNEQKL